MRDVAQTFRGVLETQVTDSTQELGLQQEIPEDKETRRVSTIYILFT